MSSGELLAGVEAQRRQWHELAELRTGRQVAVAVAAAGEVGGR